MTLIDGPSETVHPDTVHPATVHPVPPGPPGRVRTPRSWRDRLMARSPAVARLRMGAGALDRRLADTRTPLQLTLLLVILGTSDSWYVAVPVVILAIVGLILPGATDAPRFWLVLAATLGANALAGRWQVDNHQYLIAYWCLALALAAASPDAVAVRRIAARILIAAVFVLATFWKLTSPDFGDGTFMRYTILTDSRFAEVASLVGGVPPADLAANRQAVKALAVPDAELVPAALRGSTRIDLLARGLTWWTLFIEGAVAVAFVVPWRRLSRHRDALLIAFVVTTYAVAPVVGFGWVLICLGLAQHQQDRRGIRLAYLTVFLLVQAFIAPWTSVLGLMP